MSVTVFKGVPTCYLEHPQSGSKSQPQTTQVPGKPQSSDLHARGSRRKWAGRAPSRPPSTSTKTKRWSGRMALNCQVGY